MFASISSIAEEDRPTLSDCFSMCPSSRLMFCVI